MYNEARVFDKHVMSFLATKWDWWYSKMVDFVHGLMSLGIIFSNTMLLHRASAGQAWKLDSENITGVEALGKAAGW